MATALARPKPAKVITITEASAGADLAARTVLIITKHGKPGNSRRVDSNAVEVEADKKLLRISKILFAGRAKGEDACPEFAAIKNHDTKIRRYLDDMCLPCSEAGRRFLPIGLIEQVDAELETLAAARAELVNTFMAKYEDGSLKERAEQRHGVLYDPRDWPAADYVRSKFFFAWQYVSYGVPGQLKELSAAMWKREGAKAAAGMAEAQSEIRNSLRAGFLDLVGHMRDALAPKADGNPRSFHPSTVDNLRKFLATFSFRNVTDDAELQELVGRARTLLSGEGFNPNQPSPLTAADLKSSDVLRGGVLQAMTEIATKLDSLVVTKRRKFFEEED